MFDFGLYSQVSDSGPHGPLVCSFLYKRVPGGNSVEIIQCLNLLGNTDTSNKVIPLKFSISGTLCK